MPVSSGLPGVGEEDVAFARDGLTLRGTLALPEQGPAHGAVVTIHGWAATRTGPHRLFVTLGRELAARDVAALRFDLSGRGTSDGAARATSLDHMIADTHAAADFLCARTGLARVTFVGLCSGGNVAIGAAAQRPDRTGGVVCLSTLPFAPPTARQARRKAAGYLAGYARKALSLRTWRRLLRGEVSLRGVGRTVGGALAEAPDLRRLRDSAHDLMAAFARLRAPVLFVYGGADPEGAQAREHYQAFCTAQGVPTRFEAVPGANHNFYAVRWSEDLRSRVRAFVDQVSVLPAPRSLAIEAT